MSRNLRLVPAEEDFPRFFPNDDDSDLILRVTVDRVHEKIVAEGYDRDDDQLIKSLYETHLTGCIGEWGVAVWHGVPWTPAKKGGVDVLPDIQARASRHPEAGLPHYGTDKTHQRFVLALVGSDPAVFEVMIRGWLHGYGCRLPQWRTDEWGRPAWRAPQTALFPPWTFDHGADPAPSWEADLDA